MKIEEDRLDLEKVRREREDERFQRRDNIVLKNVAIDQKRIELAPQGGDRTDRAAGDD